MAIFLASFLPMKVGRNKYEINNNANYNIYFQWRTISKIRTSTKVKLEVLPINRQSFQQQITQSLHSFQPSRCPKRSNLTHK